MEKKSKITADILEKLLETSDEETRVSLIGVVMKYLASNPSNPTTDEGKTFGEFMSKDSPEKEDAIKSAIRGSNEDQRDLMNTPPESWEVRLGIVLETGGVQEITEFVTNTLATEKARWLKEWREKICELKHQPSEDCDYCYIETAECRGYVKLDDIIKLITPSEQEER